MKKLLILILGILCAYDGESQVNNNQLLEAFVNDTKFCEFVLPHCKANCDTIFVIDTLNYFNKEIEIKYNKKIILEHQLLLPQTPKSVEEIELWRCRIFITGLIKHKKRYTIKYYVTTTNGGGFVEYKIVKEQLIKTKSQYGQY